MQRSPRWPEGHLLPPWGESSRWTSLNYGTDKRDQRDNGKGLPNRVEGKMPLSVGPRRWYKSLGQSKPKAADRYVNEKNAAPSQAGKQKTSNHRPGGDRCAPCRSPDTDRPGSQAGVVSACVIEYRQGTWDQQGRSNPLDCPTGVKKAGTRGQPTSQ